MGAWGLGPFDNDDAADWVYTLEDEGLPAIESALDLGDGYVEAPAASEAVAAAAVVARAKGVAVSTSEEVEAWLTSAGSVDVVTLAPHAAAALEQVLEGSELAELHDEAGNDDWRREVEMLRDVLRG